LYCLKADHIGYCDLQTSVPGSRHQLDGGQGISSQIVEAIVSADIFFGTPQYLGKESANTFLFVEQSRILAVPSISFGLSASPGSSELSC
jgi:hypothetical protein